MSFVFLVAAGALLWWLWRIAARRAPEVRAAATTGFVARAFLGVALFFVSWLHLPIARALQQPDGLWFYAMDAARYLREAADTASGGFAAILAMRRMPPSATFVQVMAVFVRLFGAVASVGLLLNALAFLGACAAVVATARRIDAAPRATAWCIAALAFSPSLILWSTAPLKDTLLTMLLVLVYLAGLLWQHACERGSIRLGLLGLVAFWLATWAVGGIRWYLALLLWLWTPLVFVLAMRAPRGRRLRLAGASAMFVLCTFSAIVVGAEWLVPFNIYKAAYYLTWNPSTWIEFPRALFDDVSTTKRALDAESGATKIDAPRPQRPSNLERRRRLSAPRIRAMPIAATPYGARARMLGLGVAAMVVPPTLARAFGLFDVGGGRGLWLFADVDTLAFDAVLVVAVLAIVRARRRGERTTPMLWYIVGVAVSLFVVLPYLVTNYGSLFRYRSVVYVTLAVVPLALESFRPRVS